MELPISDRENRNEPISDRDNLTRATPNGENRYQPTVDHENHNHPISRQHSDEDDHSSSRSESLGQIEGPLDLPHSKRGRRSAPGALQNEFSSRKVLAHAMIDAALLMANVSQLCILLSPSGPRAYFHVALVALVSTSIGLQIIFAALILAIWTRESRVCRSRSRSKSRAAAADAAAADASARSSRSRSLWATAIRRLESRSALLGNAPPDARALLPVSQRDVSTDDDDDDEDDYDKVEEEYDYTTTRIHIATVVLVFSITVVNMFIVGLGFEPDPSVSSDQNIQAVAQFSGFTVPPQ